MKTDSNDYDFFRKLLAMHELRIKQSLIESEVDLNQFLDFTQIQLNHFIQLDIDLKKRGINFSLIDGTKTIQDIKKLQGIIVGMIDDKTTVSKEKVRPDHRLIALVYIEGNKKITESNKDKIAHANGWSSKTSGTKLKRFYTKLESDKEELKKAQGTYNAEQKNQVKIL